LVACAINAAFLAILNSGLDLKYSIAAVHCVIDNDDQVILDPDHKVSREASGYLTFVFESVNKNTVATHTDGRFTVGQYNDALLLARTASDGIFNFYREIVKKFAKEL
jgi:exosome complex component RRP46